MCLKSSVLQKKMVTKLSRSHTVPTAKVESKYLCLLLGSGKLVLKNKMEKMKQCVI